MFQIFKRSEKNPLTFLLSSNSNMFCYSVAIDRAFLSWYNKHWAFFFSSQRIRSLPCEGDGRPPSLCRAILEEHFSSSHPHLPHARLGAFGVCGNQNKISCNGWQTAVKKSSSSGFSPIFSTACKAMPQFSFKRRHLTRVKVRPGIWITGAIDLGICFRCFIANTGPHLPRRRDEIQCPLPRTLLITPYQLAPSLLIDALQVVGSIMTHSGVDCPPASSLVSSCSLAGGLQTYQLRLKRRLDHPLMGH